MKKGLTFNNDKNQVFCFDRDVSSRKQTSNDNDGNGGNQNSAICINLRRKTGIFKSSSCPIDNEDIEETDRELGKFQTLYFGIKGEYVDKWKDYASSNKKNRKNFLEISQKNHKEKILKKINSRKNRRRENKSCNKTRAI